MLTKVDPSQKGGYALEGDWLRDKALTPLKNGTVVVRTDWDGSSRRGNRVIVAERVTPLGPQTLFRHDWPDGTSMPSAFINSVKRFVP